MFNQSEALLVLLAALLLLRAAVGQDNIRPIGGNDNGRCEELTSTVCAAVGYNMVYLPNARGHDTQADAEMEISDFNQLILSGCSDALNIFLCSYYFPLCFTDPLTNTPTKVRTCRSLCEFVRPMCEPVLVNANHPWPVFLNCSLDSFSDESPCFGPTDLTNLTVLGTVNNTMPVTRVVNSQLSTTASVSPTTTETPITPTPPPQSTTTLDSAAMTSSTTRSFSPSVARVLSVRMAVMATTEVLLICNYWLV